MRWFFFLFGFWGHKLQLVLFVESYCVVVADHRPELVPEIRKGLQEGLPVVNLELELKVRASERFININNEWVAFCI